MSADPRTFVWAHGQEGYFGKTPVNDIKCAGVTVAETGKREDCLSGETAADKRESGLESNRWL